METIVENTNVTSEPVATSASELRLRQAFEATRAERDALDPKSLRHITLDVPSAIVTVFGCIPELRALKPQMAGMPFVDPDVFDKCEQYALALAHAHRQFVIASQPSEPIAEMTEALKVLRERIYLDATALAQRGLVDAEGLRALTGTNGSKNTAFDVFALVELVRGSWSRIQGKTPITLDELDRAEVLAERLANALGKREQGQSTVPETSQARQRAYALFVSTYDAARRVVTFLRWNEGDADTIAPSLWKGRGSRPGRSDTAPDPAPDGTVSPANQPAVGGGAAPDAPATGAQPAASGLPLSAPFTT